MSSKDICDEPKRVSAEVVAPSMDEHSTESEANGLTKLWKRVVSVMGVEMQGNEPVPVEQQTDRRYYKLSTLWFSMNFNLISVSTGMTGSLGFGLGLRDCTLIIIFFGMLTALSAPFLSTFGAKLGLRQMIQARYSFGKYPVIVPLILNMATLTGYAILGSTLGGQALSAINPEGLSVNVGIGIIAAINFVIVFCGSKVLHQFDLYAWIPTLLGIVVAVGCGGHHLHKQVDAAPATASSVLSFGAVIAGFFLPWSAIASDFTTYYSRGSAKTAIFLPSYIGLTLSALPLMILGSAIGDAIPNVPAWEEGYNTTSVGGVLGAMLQPSGGFGKFLLVLLALSVIPNMAGSVYALALNCQALLYLARIRIARVVYTVVLTAIIIPISMTVAAEFLTSLGNFVGIIGYWPACFISVTLVEHFFIRRGGMENYDVRHWDTASSLPTGIPALAASICSLGLVIPGMSQTWFTGPIALHTGDIGFEMAFIVTGLLYVPFRFIEVKVRGHN